MPLALCASRSLGLGTAEPQLGALCQTVGYAPTRRPGLTMVGPSSPWPIPGDGQTTGITRPVSPGGKVPWTLGREVARRPRTRSPRRLLRGPCAGLAKPKRMPGAGPSGNSTLENRVTRLAGRPIRETSTRVARAVQVAVSFPSTPSFQTGVPTRSAKLALLKNAAADGRLFGGLTRALDLASFSTRRRPRRSLYLIQSAPTTPSVITAAGEAECPHRVQGTCSRNHGDGPREFPRWGSLPLA